ncbi:putative splicing factor 3A subunit 1 domain, SWAP/Surp superfamily [Septoria linicola]|nr:putative splicing factor 3A subunit 1 domain, SWAP/Surp superfamily [Septoria linicola]
MAATNGEQPAAAAEGQEDLLSRLPEGTVLPPRPVREKIEKVAAYVARSGQSFEDNVRQKNAGTNITHFLEPEDEYNAYYKWRVTECKAGRGLDANAPAAKTDVTFQGRESRAPKAPEEFKFSARMPNISAQDLEIVKLTALYAAKNGKSWVTLLSQREANNYQFDFLRPQHSLNMYFGRLVDQYKDLIEGETADKGAPQKKRIEDLQANVENRFNLLERAKKRAEYVKYQEKQKEEKEEKQEKDRVAFAQIDWHDFSVIATITFDERDEAADMPPPKTLNDMLSLSLEEKANMRIDPNRRLEEAVPDFTDYSAIYGHQQQFPAAQMMPPGQGYAPQPPQSTTPSQGTPYQQPVAPSLSEERENARAAIRASQLQPTRVRTDYVPRAQQRNQLQNTSICPNCKQSIPNDEIAEHMRIEQLDPRWREQFGKNQQRSSTTNLSTADVANNLKRLASQRTDLFDPVTGQAITEEEKERRKRAELQAYDGIRQVPNPALGQAPPGVFPPGTQGTNMNDQIRQIHEKYGQRS